MVILLFFLCCYADRGFYLRVDLNLRILLRSCYWCVNRSDSWFSLWSLNRRCVGEVLWSGWKAGSMLGHRLASTLLSILDMVFWLWSGWESCFLSSISSSLALFQSLTLGLYSIIEVVWTFILQIGWCLWWVNQFFSLQVFVTRRYCYSQLALPSLLLC